MAGPYGKLKADKLIWWNSTTSEDVENTLETIANKASTAGDTFTGSVTINPSTGGDTALTTGSSTADDGHDVKLWGDATDKYVLWDASVNTLDLVDAAFKVTGIVAIDGPSAFGAAANFNAAVEVGENDTGHDVTLHGATSGAYLKWDQAADKLKVVGDAVVELPNVSDLDTAVTANTAKVTNATHTGDVTGATALTIAADAVDGTKIADDAIDSEHYVDGSIDNAHLAVDAVTETRIQDASVTTAKITDANVTTAKIADANVTTAKIADSSVTAAKLDAVYGVLANDQNWTGAQRGALTTVTAAGTTTFDFDLGNNFYIDMATAAITTINASNATAGQSGSIIVKGHGSNTMAGWNAVYKFSGGTAPTITADATKYDRIDYIIYDASNIHMVWSGNY